MTRIRVNGDLRGIPSVRVIGPDGESLGVMTLAEALREAMRCGLDLVEVNPSASPPVCKILDLSKYKYAERKRVIAERHDEERDERIEADDA